MAFFLYLRPRNTGSLRDDRVTADAWQTSLRRFFEERAAAVTATPSHADLCYIAGREPRLWSEPGMYEDLIASIIRECAVGPRSKILEVGCAGGFLARGVAARVGHYVGVDLARPALRVAARLGIPNARFRVADGARLRIAANSFDAAFCHDVFINLPAFPDGVPLIREMLRVVRPGGRVVIGSVPDAATATSYEAKVADVVADLEARRGALPQPPKLPAKGRIGRLRDRLAIRRPEVAPEVVCYYFFRDDFVSLGNSLSTAVEIAEVHPLNPYRGFRFDAIYTKPA